MVERILVGDLGGTKTELVLYERGDALGFVERVSERYASAEFDSFESIVDHFLHTTSLHPDRICFAVAGPVRDGHAHITNLPWQLEERALAARFDFPRVHLLNDFEAVAHGLFVLDDKQAALLQSGARVPEAPIGVIGAGTGLGEAYAWRAGTHAHVVATEGGHTDFAPRNELEFALLEFLKTRHERVSVERVVSGPGLVSIFEFLVATKRGSQSAALTELFASRDRAAVIAEFALSEKDETCRAALDIFVSAYGAELGNFALKIMPRGGLFLAGGIAPKILSALRSAPFTEAFLSKGRMRPLLESLHVAVVIDPRVGLHGARFVATHRR